MIEIPLVSTDQAVAQRDAVVPSQPMKPRNIEQLSRRTVGLRGIEDQFGMRKHDVANQFRNFANRDVFACSDVDRSWLVVVLHQEQAGCGQIIDVQEFSPRRSGSPDGQ